MRVLILGFALAVGACATMPSDTSNTSSDSATAEVVVEENAFAAAAAIGPGQGVARLFEIKASAEHPFADDAPGTYSMGLELNSAPAAPGPDRCFDTGFWRWARTAIWRTSGSVAITAEITPPRQTSAISVPIFQSVIDERASPMRCSSSMPGRWPVTPLYRADGPFLVTARVVTGRRGAVQMDRIKDLTKGLASFAGVSGDLTAKVSDPVFTAALSTLKTSIEDNWAVEQDASHQFSLEPFKRQRNAALDEAHFATPQLVRAASGVQITDGRLPAVTISPVYRQSLFGEGPGKYRGAYDVLTTPITPSKTLERVLLDGLPGFTIDDARTITTTEQMRSFCRLMRTRFSEFLTPDDALAATFAVLEVRTEYRRFAALQRADCFSATELADLKKLNAEFFSPPIEREVPSDRTEAVTARMLPLTNALLTGSTDRFKALTAKPEEVQVTTTTRARAMLGVANDAEVLQGDVALQALAGSGLIHLSCYRALPDRNLRNVVAIARNLTTRQAEAVVIEFDGDEKKADPKVVSVGFYSMAQLRGLLGFNGFGSADCVVG